MMLDILGTVLELTGIGFLTMMGSTPLSQRARLVDKFTEDKIMEFPVFLLSTKAGGVGINLSAASVVIM